MSIKYVILGYISWKPATGYDLKRIIADSEILHWSANNNQIYRGLVDLHKAGWVSKEVQQQDGSPSRHIYTITPAGREALMAWVQETPEAPQQRKAFLMQLLWADDVETAVLQELLDQYLDAVGSKLFMLRVQAARKPDQPDTSERSQYLWNMIYRNAIATYEMELDWIRQVRQELGELGKKRGRRSR